MNSLNSAPRTACQVCCHAIRARGIQDGSSLRINLVNNSEISTVSTFSLSESILTLSTAASLALSLLTYDSLYRLMPPLTLSSNSLRLDRLYRAEPTTLACPLSTVVEEMEEDYTDDHLQPDYSEC